MLVAGELSCPNPTVYAILLEPNLLLSNFREGMIYGISRTTTQQSYRDFSRKPMAESVGFFPR